MCEKCNKNFFHGGKLAGQLSTHNAIIRMLEKLPFWWVGDKQLVTVDKRELIQSIKDLSLNEDR